MRVRVTVHPGARRERVEKSRSGALTVHVREKAQRGEATARVRALVALQCGVSLSAVRCVSGARGPVKTFDVLQ